MFLSIIVPVYNAEAYLAECLDSLLAQDISDYEIICINDGSQDSSPVLLHEYAKKHSIIRVLDKKNGGVTTARNAGLNIAQGDYIWFVDADDFLLPNSLGSLREEALRTHCDRIIVGGYQFVNALTEEESALAKENKLPLNVSWYDSVVWRNLLRQDFLRQHNLFFRYPELTHGEDGLFMYEVGLYEPKSVEVTDILYFYREHPGSAETTVSLDNCQKKQRSYLRIAQILRDYYHSGRRDSVTADKMMTFLWFSLYETAKRSRKDALLVLRQMHKDGLFPFRRPHECLQNRAYMTQKSGLVGTILDFLCRHLHTCWGFWIMWLLQHLKQWKHKA